MKNYMVKLYKNNQLKNRYETLSIRRFLNKIRSVNWENSTFKVYLRISYGYGIYNSGTYSEKKKFTKALKAFLEE